MNSKAVCAFLLALALLIVLPVLSTVNATPVQHVSGNSVLVADGSPGPPPAPNPWLLEPVMVADGSPGPPPAPNPWLLEPVMVADGSPGPPPAPNPWLLPQSELVAA
jgi:hypothetical protein